MRNNLFVAFLANFVNGLSKMQTLENLVYPWPSRADWPSLKMSYNYQLSGYVTGKEIVKDGTYSYSRNKAYDEPRVEQEFSYYTTVKVDSKNLRAVQRLYRDETRQELISASAMDFANARLMFVEYEEGKMPGLCKVY